MMLADFEPLLRDLLAARPEVAAVRTFAEAGYTLYGVQVRLTDGTVVWVRLTRGPGPAGNTGTVPPRDGELEHPAPTALPDDVATAAETLLRVTAETGDVPGLAYAQTMRERRNTLERSTKTLRQVPPGLVLHFDDGDEIYVAIHG